MKFLGKEIVKRIRREYPQGTRVEPVQMDDAQAQPIGTKGTVVGVDDTASLLVRWDNGSHLNVVYGELLCHSLIGWSFHRRNGTGYQLDYGRKVRHD